jgi:hypothetical protein
MSYTRILEAKSYEHGFIYEFGEHKGKVHILQVNKANNQIRDFFWDGMDIVDEELRKLNNIHRGLSPSEVMHEYLPDICLDNIHKWVEVQEEDFHN